MALPEDNLPQDIQPGGTPLSCRDVVAEPGALRALRHRLTAWVRAAGVPEDRAQDIVLASYEALANVADHAYGGDGRGLLDLEAVVRRDRVEIVITDHGHWRAPVDDPNPVSLRGRGLLLLRASADHADIVPGVDGTVVTLGWNLIPARSH
ncbi:ATP-binding protein [Amycolatopsis sp. DSM 110486]|uniref:ATP-binding protein n=1 Tax=Amycolatopsis sp. DSM 110486 TaxID=2865832 RepID=UPI00351CF2F1